MNLLWIHICQFIYFLGNMIAGEIRNAAYGERAGREMFVAFFPELLGLLKNRSPFFLFPFSPRVDSLVILFSFSVAISKSVKNRQFGKENKIKENYRRTTE